MELGDEAETKMVIVCQLVKVVELEHLYNGRIVASSQDLSRFALSSVMRQLSWSVAELANTSMLLQKCRCGLRLS